MPRRTRATNLRSGVPPPGGGAGPSWEARAAGRGGTRPGRPMDARRAATAVESVATHSPTAPVRWRGARRCFSLGLGGEQVAEEQGVHVAGQEVADGFGGAVDDRLAAGGEAGVEDD